MPKLSKNTSSISLTIRGRVIAKKNSRKIFVRHGKLFNIPSEAYRKFTQRAKLDIPINTKVNPPYEIHYLFEMKGKLDSDIDNMIASINDVLQDHGVIEDDKKILNIKATKELGFDDFRTIVLVRSMLSSLGDK